MSKKNIPLLSRIASVFSPDVRSTGAAGAALSSVATSTEDASRQDVNITTLLTARSNDGDRKDSVESDNSANDSARSTMALSRVTLFDISDKYAFCKESKANGRVHFKFNPRDGLGGSIGDQPVDVAQVLLNNVKAVIGGASAESGSADLRKHSNYISFPSEEMFAYWSKKVGISVDEVSVVREGGLRKKIVVLGAGDVGKSVVRELGAYHDKYGIPCEIVLFNRNAALARHCINDVKENRVGAVSSVVSYRAADSSRDIYQADLFIMTAGVKAGRIGAESRKDALIYNVDIIDKYSKLIKDNAKPDTKVIVVTNPVEMVTKLMQESSGLPTENIIGSGVWLDSIRYAEFLEDELRKYHNTEAVKATVIGQHDRNGMIFLRDQLTLGGRPISELVEYGSIGQERLNRMLDLVETRARSEGIAMATSSRRGQGACDKPAEAVCEIAANWMYGNNTPNNTLSAAVYVKEGRDNPYGVQGPCYVGLPITFASDGKFKVFGDCTLTEEQRGILIRVSKELVDTRSGMPLKLASLVPLSMSLNDALENSERRSSIMDGFNSIWVCSKGDLESRLNKLGELFHVAIADGTSNTLVIKIKHEDHKDFTHELFGHLAMMARGFGLLESESKSPVRGDTLTMTVTSEFKTMLRNQDVLKPASLQAVPGAEGDAAYASSTPSTAVKVAGGAANALVAAAAAQKQPLL